MEDLWRSRTFIRVDYTINRIESYICMQIVVSENAVKPLLQ